MLIDREQALEHVLYEIEMFEFSACMISNCSRRTWRDNYRRNCYLEAFLVHFRNLHDFFFNANPHKDDVTVDRVFHGSEWKVTFPAKSSSLDRWKVEANKRLAHLTTVRYERKAGDEFEWLFSEIIRDMRPFIEWFADQTDTHSVIQNARICI